MTKYQFLNRVDPGDENDGDDGDNVDDGAPEMPDYATDDEGIDGPSSTTSE